MISVRHRFHGHNSLNPVYGHGQTVRGQFISLKYLNRPPGRPYRAAVVVSRKVHKSAVVRNRIRRRIYEIVRQADGDLTSGRDMIFTVFSDQLAVLSQDRLAAAIQELLKKAAAKPANLSQTPVSHGIVNKPE
jgi:ribonuclease P protein component